LDQAVNMQYEESIMGILLIILVVVVIVVLVTRG
jgi:hypothetical protein